VDPYTGYRRYATGQIPTAQVIRRFRDLGMPLEEIQGVLSAPALRTRNERISAHLSRLEDDLGRTQSAVASLRDLLAPHSAESAPARIELRGVPANVPAGGPAGGVYGDEVFTRHRGLATIFVPCAGPVRPMGRVTSAVIPATELAVIEHLGPPDEIDRAYGTLATCVARHALAVDGPIREYYLVGQHDTPDTSRWRTQIGWPIFLTSTA
jgi:DNA-binding transcriptional MerR regulator